MAEDSGEVAIRGEQAKHDLLDPHGSKIQSKVLTNVLKGCQKKGWVFGCLEVTIRIEPPPS